MNDEKTAQALTRDDFVQAVADAGGPKAVKTALDGLQMANDQLAREYGRILEQYPRHWIAVGPDGLIATVPVPEDSSDEDQQHAMEKLFQLIEESETTRNGYLVRYIDPDGGALIL